MAPCDLDVLIIGAGLAGIGAACRLATKCPEKSFAVLEARARLGGTWDFFRYPGLRSDSDMYTLGYPFRPWTRPESIASGASILSYIRETAEAYGVDRKIRFGQKVARISWSTAEARWTVEAEDATTGDVVRTTCRFLFMCSGYYDYAGGHAPKLPGSERFGGPMIHPQAWPADLDYTDKKIVVIGSGATAVTLLPELAKRAAHVTMLQRSPTYMVAQPSHDPLARWLNGKLSPDHVSTLMRWKSVTVGTAFHAFCKRFPGPAKRLLVGRIKAELPGTPDVGLNFSPRYAPWDQRLCLVPDADLFATLRDGRASIVTDEIRTFTGSGIELASGKTLEADIVVTATGPNVRLFGGAVIEVDGARVEPGDGLVYRGMMLGGVPNLALAVGFANVAWTLKCDLASLYVCRLLDHMDEHGYAICCPRRDSSVEQIPLIDYTSGYALRAGGVLPRQGAEPPWRLRQNYFLELAMTRHAPLEDGVMQFSRAS